MATWTLTFLPIQQILLNGGRMPLGSLVSTLMKLDARRFRNEEHVANDIEIYCACLERDGEIIKFNRKAKSYAQFDIMERSIQYELHHSIPNPETWQLYPLVIRSNSEKCPQGIPWDEIPKDPDYDGKRIPYDDHCDVTASGCRVGCNIREEVLRRHNLMK